MIEIAQTSQSKYNSINIVVGGILPRDASWSIDQVLIKEVNEILKPKCSKSFFIYISYDNCWTVADGSLNPDLFLLDNIHLVKKGNLKLAEYSVQRHHLKHKQFLISYKMAVSFKLNNFDFPIFSTVSKPGISSNFYLSKPVYSRNISSSRSIPSSDVCQSRSNVIPSKPVHPTDVCPSKPVRRRNVIPSKPVCPGNACLSKTARPSKFYYGKPICPSNICPNKPVSLSNICLRKPAHTIIAFPRKPACPINVCPSKPVCPSNAC